jgi:hypothetical protein
VTAWLQKAAADFSTAAQRLCICVGERRIAVRNAPACIENKKLKSSYSPSCITDD